MMEPFPSLLVSLLHTVHRTSDASQLTLLPDSRVHLVSLDRGVSCQREMRFLWGLLLRCVLVQEMLYLVKVFVEG